MKKNRPAKKYLIIMASGTGTLFSSVVRSCDSGVLKDKAKVISLVSDNDNALVIKKARDNNIPVKIINPKKFPSFEEWDKALLSYLQKKSPLQNKSPDLILLAGFVKKIGPRVLSSFEKKILNIHPSLLPRHGGSGMYGLHVHRSVLKAGDKKTGISIHWVSAKYDEGPLVAQKEIPISLGETAESLQQKVKKAEQKFYIDVLYKVLIEKEKQ